MQKYVDMVVGLGWLEFWKQLDIKIDMEWESATQGSCLKSIDFFLPLSKRDKAIWKNQHTFKVKAFGMLWRELLY